MQKNIEGSLKEMHGAEAREKALIARLADVRGKLEFADKKLKNALTELKAQEKRLADKHKVAVMELDGAHRNELDQMIDENLRETEKLNEEFIKSQEMMAEQNRLLTERLAQVEDKFANRPSRPEDLKRIEELREGLKRKELTIKKMAQEMKFFKLELLNREQNFNKMFNRAPNVGVMQVVKSKPPVGPSKKALPPMAAGKRRGSSSRRTRQSPTPQQGMFG